MRSNFARSLLVGLIAVVTACGSAPDPVESPEEPSSFGDQSIARDLRPQDGAPIFLGVANRRRDRADEEAVAIEHVARQASRYVHIAAIYQYVSQRDSNGIGYLDDITTYWDENLAAEFTDSVDVLTSTRTDTATLVVARVRGLPSAPDLRHIDTSADEEVPPPWVVSTPEVPGYLVAVGTAQKRRTPRDTVDATDQEALKAILIQTGSTLRMVEDRRSVERRGTTSSVIRSEEARATLSEFHVVARYATADGRYHYSLAIAREE